MQSNEVYQLVGGPLYNSHLAKPSGYRNACAVRVSRALNYSYSIDANGNPVSIFIPEIPGQTEKGADGKNYFKSAANLSAWMEKTFGKPAFPNRIPGSYAGEYGSGFLEYLNNKKGVFIIVNAYPTTAGYTGHADIINNGACNLDPKGGVGFINIWPLQRQKT